MHPGQALARLNAKTVRFDIGRGGRSELDPQDIAAAVAMVPAGLGRELLCRVWWPDGAALTAGKLDAQLQDMQVREWLNRENIYHVSTGLVALNNADDFTGVRARAKLKDAQKARWPQWIVKTEPLTLSQGYALIRAAVVEELCNPKLCSDCGGRGHVTARELVRACTRCDGTGHTSFGPTWRAKRLDMKESSYKQTWEHPYEWLLDQADAALRRAEHAFRAALAD